MNSTILSLSLSKILNDSPLFTGTHGARLSIINSKFSKISTNLFYSFQQFHELKLKTCFYRQFTKSVLFILEPKMYYKQTFNKRQNFHDKTVSISECIFERCTSNERGGAIYMFYSTSIEVKKTTFSNCKSLQEGGAIDVNLNECNMSDICSYECYCGSNKLGNAFHMTCNEIYLERLTFVECSSKAMKEGSCSTFVKPVKYIITDFNNTYEFSQKEGGIIINDGDDGRISNIYLGNVESKEQFLIYNITDINNIAFVNCSAELSLITPQIENMTIYYLILRDCKGPLLKKSDYDKSLLICDSFFDVDYGYSLTENCEITKKELFSLEPNNLKDCAKGIELYSEVDTKLIDTIVIIVVLVVLILCLILSSVWFCWLHIPLQDKEDRIENNLRMTLPLVDDEA